jgi:hypothetical protein
MTMRNLLKAGLFTAVLFAVPGHAGAQDAAPDISSLTWLHGTRYIERADGSRAYETWIGPAAGLMSGAVVSSSGGGLVEYFRIGPNEDGVIGLSVANSTRGLTNWRFSPLLSLEPGKVVFGEPDGSRGFSIESTPDGGIHNVSTTVTNGETSMQEWYWLPDD